MQNGVVSTMVAVISVMPPHNPDLPRAISAFYDDWNFVVVNSTVSERNTVWMLAEAGQAENLAAAGQEIVTRMARIERIVEHRTSERPTLRYIVAPVRSSELHIVHGARHREDGSISVVVARATLSPATARSIDSPAWPVDPDSIASDRISVSTHYIDRWERLAGGWRQIHSAAIPIGSAW